MTRVRLLWIFAAHVVVGAALLGWAMFEDRRQQADVERSLVTVASVLGGSLGPGLSAASDATRELDEIVTWRLLDNARLLALIGDSDPESHDRLERIVEANDLDTVVFVDPSGTIRCSFGEPVAPDVLGGVEEILAGRAEEVVLGSIEEAGVEHLAAAAATSDGGAVLARIHAASGRTFLQRLGVASLLERLVKSEGVLYLSYREEPGGLLAEAAWDGGPVPEPPPSRAKLRSVRDRSVFEVDVPVEVPAGGRAAVRVGLDGAALQRAAVSGMRRTLLVGLVLAGYALATVSLAGVSRLRAIEKEESARRLAESERARRGSERLAAAGALAAGLAHEVRSPLNAIALAAQRLERASPGGDDCRRFARLIRDEVKRLESVLRDFLEFARPVRDERQDVELSTLAAEVVELLQPEAESREVRLELCGNAAKVPADREAVRRAIINLLKNALQATARGGRVRIVVDREGGWGRLRILDEGPGVAPEIEGKAFEAFVTTRASGAGLGLSLVRRVAEEHGGSCSLVNRRDGGAEACLRLPGSEETSS